MGPDEVGGDGAFALTWAVRAGLPDLVTQWLADPRCTPDVATGLDDDEFSAFASACYAACDLDGDLSDDERTRLLAQTIKDPTLHVLVVLALSTAARAGELTGLQWKDVDLKEGRLLFRDTKNTETRAAWLYGDALRLLKDHAKVRQLHKDDVFPRGGKTRYDYAKPFSAAVAAAEVADFRFHDL